MIITPAQYLELRATLIGRGYGKEIDWAETVGAPDTAEHFATEYVWVVLNSGMKNQVARGIADRLWPVLARHGSATEVFGHPGKAAAIDLVWTRRHCYFARFQIAGDILAFCHSLPWIGPITKYHLAKNYGGDFVKPDRHLVRIAKATGETPDALCERLADATGDRVGTVDLVLWRGANLGVLPTGNPERLQLSLALPENPPDG